MEYYSQYKQDKFLHENIFKDHINGIFVDAGAHDGISLNNTLFFEKNYNWTGINIEPINLKTFLRNKNPAIGAPFLQSIKHIDTIKFDKSISMFHDINELIIIFHQKKCNADSTKKETSNRTKKVFINSNPKKKTKKKEFKETTA
jgi:hypothetical protein